MSATTAAVLAVKSSGLADGYWLDLAQSLARDPAIAVVNWCGAAPSIQIDGVVATHAEPWDIVSGAARSDREMTCDDLPVAIMFEAPVELPPDFVERVTCTIRADRRNAVVSFLSDRADDTCLFDQSRAGRSRTETVGLTATQINALLPQQSQLIQLATPGGWVHAIDTELAATFACPSGPERGDPAVEEPARATLAQGAASLSGHGFHVLLDPTLYLTAVQPGPWVAAPAEAAPSPPLVSDSSCADALALVRAAVFGLDVAVDATCLGPFHEGTQTQVVALIEALAAEPRVRSVCVAARRDGLPDYAAHLTALPHVRIARTGPLGMSEFGPVDIIHRPFPPQLRPARGPWGIWSTQAARTALTVLDLISFDIAAYSAPDDLAAHRKSIALAVESADHVIAISTDGADQIHRHGFDLPPDRLSAVPLGTDHLVKSDAVVPPPGLPAAMGEHPFVLVGGTDLAHKNRDLAIAAWQELRRRGHDALGLVLMGRHCELGSSATAESALLTGVPPVGCLDLGQVPEAQRNWLLKHAAVVLYPTSAEGFGFVPFEAAQVGTATVWVPFGPLAELLPDTAGTARSWAPTDLADAAQRLLADDATAALAVDQVLKAGAALTWTRTATATVDAYFTALSMPKRAPHRMAEAERLAARAARFQSDLQTANQRLAEIDGGWAGRSHALARRVRNKLRRRHR